MSHFVAVVGVVSVKYRFIQSNISPTLFFFHPTRQLNHPSIVKYFGTNLRHGSDGTTVMIVLELCKCSLKKEVMSQPQNAPANVPKVVPHKKVQVWALQILDALRYIHSEGFVHRDLKLENLLVSWS